MIIESRIRYFDENFSVRRKTHHRAREPANMVRMTWGKHHPRRKRVNKSPTENDPSLKWGCVKGRSSPRKKPATFAPSQTKSFYLRPVDGKGLLPIPLKVGEPKIIGSKTALETMSQHVLNEHVEVTVEVNPVPRLRVDAAFRSVYIRGRQGMIEKLEHGYETILDTGCILYLAYDSRRGEALFGYILTENTPGTKNVSPGEQIEILDSDSDTECEASGGTEENTTADNPEISSWITIETTEDLDSLPVKQSRYMAKTLGVDTSGFLEKSEYAKALGELKIIGREQWLSRRKKAEEQRLANKQLQVTIREKKIERDKTAAIQKVKLLALNANLKIFLQRIDIKVDERAICNRQHLKNAYRKAMMKYHPDKTQAQNSYDRFLAEEITKWVTREWNSIK